MKQNTQQESHKVCKECGTPAGAGTYCKWAACPGGDRPAPMSYAGPITYPREVYIGIYQDPDLGPTHLILLPDDVSVGSIEDADDFVDSVGGDLPTFGELQYLHERAGHLFKPCIYYSCDQEDYDGQMVNAAFDFAHQVAPGERDQPRQVRARAVRRVLAKVESGIAGAISAQQVATLAEQLIDQHAIADGEESIERARMVGTGIMVGIRLMATEVQKALSFAAPGVGDPQ